MGRVRVRERGRWSSKVGCDPGGSSLYSVRAVGFIGQSAEMASPCGVRWRNVKRQSPSTVAEGRLRRCLLGDTALPLSLEGERWYRRTDGNSNLIPCGEDEMPGESAMSSLRLIDILAHPWQRCDQLEADGGDEERYGRTEHQDCCRTPFVDRFGVGS